MKNREEFMRRVWDFQRSSETLAAGNYEWPFEMIIPGCTPDSLEGLTETWVVYRMKATIERAMLQQNTLARRQVRIIRTLDPAALELSHAMVCTNVIRPFIIHAFGQHPSSSMALLSPKLMFDSL